MMYFPTKRGAKEPQNPQNHRVVKKLYFRFSSRNLLNAIVVESDQVELAGDV